MSSRKIIIISLIIFGLLSLASIIYYLIPKAYIKFETAPNQVEILIDNKDRHTITNGDSITIAPGKHTITVFRDEFNPYIKEIDVNNGQTNNFLVALVPLTDAARNLLNNAESDAIMQQLTNVNMTNDVNIMEKNYPILKVLPIEARLYSISSCPSVKYPDNHTRIALCIDMTLSDDTEANLRAYAIKNIEDHGFNPSDYEIIWSTKPDPSLQP